MNGNKVISLTRTNLIFEENSFILIRTNKCIKIFCKSTISVLMDK